MAPKLTTLVVLPLFYTKNWHADLEFTCKFCFLVYVLISDSRYKDKIQVQKCYTISTEGKK